MAWKQKCPPTNSILQWIFRLGLMALGAVGLYFLNVWVAVGFVILYLAFYILIMPLKACKYCWYMVEETTTDTESGKTCEKRLPLDKWKKSCMKKHEETGKTWWQILYVLWFGPIILIVISFFLSFDIIALLSLIGFIGVLAVSLIHMLQKVCTTCAIKEYCFKGFKAK